MIKKKVYMAGCGGMLGEAFYQNFKQDYQLKCTDKDVNEEWLSFLDFRDKWAIVLALTSNSGGLDFQLTVQENGLPLYKNVLSAAQSWGDNIMFVIGATRAEMLKEIRALVPDSFLLIPGVGVQGGDLVQVAQNGLNQQCGLLVNSSRGIIYAGNDKNFAKEARKEALFLQKQMAQQLLKRSLI